MSVLWIVFVASFVLTAGSFATVIGRATDRTHAESPSDTWQDWGALLGFAGATFALVGSFGALFLESSWPDLVMAAGIPAGVSVLFTLVMLLIVRRSEGESPSASGKSTGGLDQSQK